MVTISVQEIKGNKIFVLGQVNKPGEFIVNPSVNIMQALSMAGGMTPFAATNDIIVLRGQGKQQNAMAFRYNDVVRGRSLDTNIELLEWRHRCCAVKKRRGAWLRRSSSRRRSLHRMPVRGARRRERGIRRQLGNRAARARPAIATATTIISIRRAARSTCRAARPMRR